MNFKEFLIENKQSVLAKEVQKYLSPNEFELLLKVANNEQITTRELPKINQQKLLTQKILGYNSSEWVIIDPKYKVLKGYKL